MDQQETIDVEEVEIVLKNVALAMGLVVNAVTLTASKVHIEKEPFRVDMPKPGRLEALILGPNLAAFLNKQVPSGLKDFKVELRDGKIFVQASVMLMKASAVCTLRIQDGEALYVDLESVDVLGVGAKSMVQNQLDKINPVINVQDLPVESTLTDFEIADGKLVLRGDIVPVLR